MAAIEPGDFTTPYHSRLWYDSQDSIEESREQVKKVCLFKKKNNADLTIQAEWDALVASTPLKNCRGLR